MCMLSSLQVGDTGVIEAEGGAGSVVVTDCQVAAGYVLHVGEVSGTLSVGQTVKVSHALVHACMHGSLMHACFLGSMPCVRMQNSISKAGRV